MMVMCNTSVVEGYGRKRSRLPNEALDINKTTAVWKNSDPNNTHIHVHAHTAAASNSSRFLSPRHLYVSFATHRLQERLWSVREAESRQLETPCLRMQVAELQGSSEALFGHILYSSR